MGKKQSEHELKDVTEKRYGIDLPLADLFYWGTEHDGTGDITAATKVGVSTVEGTACDHFAFRQKDVDWELWIEQGAHPLPRKLVITTTSEKSRPQHGMVLSWDLAPKLTDDLFTFAPPPDAHKVEFDTSMGRGVWCWRLSWPLPAWRRAPQTRWSSSAGA